MDKITVSLISISIIFIATTLGSSFVFFFKKIGDKMNGLILGFASGIMIAASFFGLIIPSINQGKEYFNDYSVLVIISSFLIGALILYILDKVVPHFHINGVEEGMNSTLNKNLKFFLAVTMHNIPEGLSVGFALGLCFTNNDESFILSALSLAIGIAIQNVPEGSAISIPLYSNGLKKSKSFLLGTLSGVVEPIFAILGLFLARLSFLSPFLLSIAAGMMIYVTLDELLPEARKCGYEHYGLWSFMIGFSIMMALEIIL